MDQNTKNLLRRWNSLENGDGLKRAASWAMLLWLVGLVLCFVVVFGIIYGLHPAAIAATAAAGGWLIAETNALRTRLAQWPMFKEYIDWQRVRRDIGESESG